MKNIFKSLMLVAVAAMAFTACQKEDGVVVNNNDGTTYTMVVKLDATRSAFGELDSKSFSSYWEGNENLAVYAVNFDEVYYDGTTATITVDPDDAGTAKIAFTLPALKDGDKEYPAPTFLDHLRIGSPSESVSVGAYSCNVNWTNLMEQTPRKNNVDAKAHVVVVEDEYVDLKSANSLTFKHAVAYAKMNITALPEGVTSYKQVKVKLNNIDEYTLNTSDCENIWFAVKEATPTSAEVTIVVDEDNSYKKELNLAGADKFKFVNGHVTGFNVDMSSAVKVDSNVVEGITLTDKEDLGYNDSYYFYGYTLSNANSDSVKLYVGDNNGTESRINDGNYTYLKSKSQLYYGAYFCAESVKLGGTSKTVSDGTMTVSDGKMTLTLIFNDSTSETFIYSFE